MGFEQKTVGDVEKESGEGALVAKIQRLAEMEEKDGITEEVSALADECEADFQRLLEVSADAESADALTDGVFQRLGWDGASFGQGSLGYRFNQALIKKNAELSGTETE